LNTLLLVITDPLIWIFFAKHKGLCHYICYVWSHESERLHALIGFVCHSQISISVALGR